jgi:soluble lytic murein transglycosylase
MLLAQAEKRPGGAGAQARWFAALLLDGEDETARAEPLFDAVAREATDPVLRTGAQWRLGWAAYRAGRFTEARRRFEAMSGVASEPVARLQARYWAARAAEKAGQGAPEAEMATLVQDAPLSYYGWRAREWLAKRGALPKPRPLRSPLPDAEAALGPRDALRAHILVQAELGAAATEEIDRLAARANAPSDTLLVAGLYQEAGAWDRAQAIVVKRHGDVLPLGPTEGQEGLWRAAWPQAFAEPVRRGARQAIHLEPGLLWALMREESGFRPAVASPAGARGLLQLMPETAARVADQIGFSGYDDELLVDPASNVRLGAAYLDALVGRFGGRASAAIGSYNAGPEPVTRWLAERPGQADDEWVETIPYEETRNYVKRVLRSLHAYRELYADER